MLKKAFGISVLILLLLSSVAFAVKTVKIDETLEDIDISHFDNRLENSYRTLIKFNISSIPAGKVMDAKLFLYRGGGNGWSGDVNVYGIDNQTWQESYDAPSLWSMNSSRTYFRQFSGKWASVGWDWLDVTDSVKSDHESGNENTSFWLEDPNFNTTAPNNVGNHILPSYLYLGRSAEVNNYTALRSSEDNIDTIPYLEITYDEVPVYSNISTQLVDNFTEFGYSNFSIAWDDDNENLITYLENNFSAAIVNDSMFGNNSYYYNSSVLAAGTYRFRFVAVDSAGNENSTDIYYFTIERGRLNISLTFIPSKSVINPTETTVTGIENNLWDDNVVYELWRGSTLINDSLYQDVSTLDIGSYFYIFNASGGQNWTSSSINGTLTVEPFIPVSGGAIIGGATLYIPPPERAEEKCTEEWGCSEWSECNDGLQTRECIDNNDCGTENRKPLETLECSVPQTTVSEETIIPETETNAPTGLFLGLETGSIIATVISVIVILILIIFERKSKKNHDNVMENLGIPSSDYQTD
jgi:hypothetical protein